MESQQIVDYISEQLRAGHSEANLRQHMLAHGWGKAATDDAFERYNQRVMPKPTVLAKAKRHYRAHATKWTRARFIKLGVSFAVVAIVAAGAYMFWPQDQAVQASAPPPLTYKARQSFDVSTLGSAISQYAAQNAAIPISVSVATDGNLVLCGVTCDPTTSNVGHLGVYKPSGVKFVAYDPALIAPDKTTLYVVPGASCASTTAIGEANTNPRAVVILYAQFDGSALHPRCVTL